MAVKNGGIYVTPWACFKILKTLKMLLLKDYKKSGGYLMFQ